MLLVTGLLAASCHSQTAVVRPAVPARHVATTPPSTAAVTSTTRPVATTVSPTSTVTDPPGPPYPLRTGTVPLVDRSRPTVSHGRTVSPVRSLPTEVWWPDRPGRWPLIVFAHGFDVGPDPYVALLESWAAHGYVVAAPEFPLTDPARAGADLDEADINNQPQDVRFVTDELIAGVGGMAGRIDPTRVAVAGHSDGAETALAAATVTPVPAGQARYRALAVMSGQPVDGAAGRNPPILVTQGDVDSINPPSYGLGVYDQAAAPRYLLTMTGAGHLPPYEAGSPWLGGIEAATESFFDTYLAGDRAPGSIPASVAGRSQVSLRTG